MNTRLFQCRGSLGQQRTLGLSLVALGLVFGFVQPTGANARLDATHEDILVALTEQPRFDWRSPLIAPDGEMVLARVETRSLKENRVRESWQKFDLATGSAWKTIPIPSEVKSVVWRNSIEASFVAPNDSGEPAIWLYNIETNSAEIFWSPNIEDFSAALLGPHIWSPSGKSLAFTASARYQLSLPYPSGEAYPAWISRQTRRNALYILDAKDSDVRQLSVGEFNISNDGESELAWSPDGTEIAFVREPVSNPQPSSRFHTQLATIDLKSGRIRSLPHLGNVSSPMYSPSGQYLAFYDDHGQPLIGHGGYGAVLDLRTYHLHLLPKGQRRGGPVAWMSDESAVLFRERYKFSSRFRAFYPETSRSSIVDVDSSVPPLSFFGNRQSFSADARHLAFTSSTPTKPPEIFVRTSDPYGETETRRLPLTDLGGSFTANGPVKAVEIRWESSDGVYEIPGILLTPRAVIRDGKPTAPLPLVTYLPGGPDQVGSNFNRCHLQLCYALAARGYAVLLPFSRGRDSMPDEFGEGIRNSGTRYALPFADVEAGINHLVTVGIADPDRLGIAGHSYGAGLTAYAITATNRFKAAFFDEGHVDITNYVRLQRDRSWVQALARDAYGLRDRFNDRDQASLIANSPIWQADQISTPTLIQCGVKASGHTDRLRDHCGPFYGALQHFNVPSEYFIYDEGHGFKKPTAIHAARARAMAWFDHWLLGHPLDLGLRKDDETLAADETRE